VLYLSKGCPVVITYNHQVEIGLTNGATASFSSMQLSPRDEAAAAVSFASDPLQPYFLQDFSSYMTLDMRDDDGVVRHTPITGVEEWELPVVPIRKRVCSKIKHNGVLMQKSFARTAFYQCLAFASTDYKVQGKSFKRAIVDINSLYVMLSRVRTLAGLRILRPFRESDVMMSLTETYKNEMERLSQYRII
jgi:hypothetical protein